MCGALSLLSLLCVVRIRCYVYIHVTILYLRRTGSSDYFYSLQEYSVSEYVLVLITLLSDFVWLISVWFVALMPTTAKLESVVGRPQVRY